MKIKGLIWGFTFMLGFIVSCNSFFMDSDNTVSELRISVKDSIDAFDSTSINDNSKLDTCYFSFNLFKEKLLYQDSNHAPGLKICPVEIKNGMELHFSENLYNRLDVRKYERDYLLIESRKSGQLVISKRYEHLREVSMHIVTNYLYENKIIQVVLDSSTFNPNKQVLKVIVLEPDKVSEYKFGQYVSHHTDSLKSIEYLRRKSNEYSQYNLSMTNNHINYEGFHVDTFLYDKPQNYKYSKNIEFDLVGAENIKSIPDFLFWFYVVYDGEW